MNFFQQQESARKQSKLLLLGFAGVTLLIVIVIDLLALFLIGFGGPLSTDVVETQQQGISELFSKEVLSQHAGFLLAVSAITAGTIGLSSLFKIASLRSGGAKVAADLGGTLVTADTRDPLRRRLYNVVEEISIASGTPVPDVFVLENEPGINAFAAGYSPSDAAVAVTQGTLEKLNRAELQGVVAHEFSHIFNGDMRINIRLMGVLFGIMVLAIMGRKFLHASRYRISSSRNNNGGAIIAIGGGLMVIGYIGLFFARWMKSAISRQREYLADASAVQFTRDPSGISGALKKIAAYNHSSYLNADAEEISHMLFGSGYRSLMFATHPPLEKRIQRIEKHFDASEINDLATKLRKQEHREHLQAKLAEEEQSKKAEQRNKGSIFDIDRIIDNIGNPETGLIAAAAMFTGSLSENITNAAHSTEWSPEVLLYCLLDIDENIREEQLLVVIKEMGDISEGKIRHLISSNGLVKIEERLPIMEMAFPSLKRRPVIDIQKILTTVDRMSKVDNQVDTFEYLLSRLVDQYLIESSLPNRTRLHGTLRLKDCIDELAVVVGVLAAHGQNSKSSEGLQAAQKAFRAGMAAVEVNHKNLTFTDKWQDELDEALLKLNKLAAKEKAKVVLAMGKTVLDDNEVITEEQEMMRVMCSLLHVPLPMLQSVE